jgi:hypothetical protein
MIAYQKLESKETGSSAYIYGQLVFLQYIGRVVDDTCLSEHLHQTRLIVQEFEEPIRRFDACRVIDRVGVNEGTIQDQFVNRIPPASGS